MTRKAGLHIICSDRARNGKTLLARLLADWLVLTGEAPLAVDHDLPASPFAGRTAAAARRVDFTRTPERVALFDAVIAAPGRAVVVDVPAPLLDRWIEEATTVGFLEAAAEQGPVPQFLHVIDRDRASLDAARRLAARVAPAMVWPVRNRAIGDCLEEADAAAVYLDLGRGGEIVLPALSADALAFVETPGFTFARFMRGDLAAPSARLSFELRDFCETMFDQFERMHFRVDMAGLRDMGLV